jgi:hypothetical protein
MEGKAQGGHEWLIEFEKMPQSLQSFAQILDDELKKLNSDYEAKRTGNLSLNFPLIKAMPKDAFYSWLKTKEKLGGQHKVPRLANNRTFLEEILQLHQETTAL